VHTVAFLTLYMIYSSCNSLPDDVVSACSVNSFKRRFELIWRGFSLYYDYKSDITGSQCENSISLVLIDICVNVIYFGWK